MQTPVKNIEQTMEALKERNFEPVFVKTKEEALETVKSLIPQGASVMNGASETLREIGYIDLLRSEQHGWNNLHAAIVAETDETKKKGLRNGALFADYYLGSVHALTENGELVIASNSGSQLPHLAFTSPNIILVVGTQKIVASLDTAMKRIAEHVVPLEDARMKKVMGYGTLWAKTLILNRENPAIGRKIRVILVDEKLGF